MVAVVGGVNSHLLYSANAVGKMPLARQFVKARISELRDGVWELVVQYMFYNIYTFEERSIHETLEAAKDKLIMMRCPDFLAINKDASVITLQT